MGDICYQSFIFGDCISQDHDNVLLRAGFCVTQHTSSNELIFGLYPFFQRIYHGVLEELSYPITFPIQQTFL